MARLGALLLVWFAIALAIRDAAGTLRARASGGGDER